MHKDTPGEPSQTVKVGVGPFYPMVPTTPVADLRSLSAKGFCHGIEVPLRPHFVVEFAGCVCLLSFAGKPEPWLPNLVRRRCTGSGGLLFIFHLVFSPARPIEALVKKLKGAASFFSKAVHPTRVVTQRATTRRNRTPGRD